MMTGRWPFKVGYYANPGDDGGVPDEFEMLPQMLRRRFGYRCHHVRRKKEKKEAVLRASSPSSLLYQPFPHYYPLLSSLPNHYHQIGKWHLGFRKASMTPTLRGFDTSLGFYHWGGEYDSHEFPPQYALGRGQGCQGFDVVNASSAEFAQEEQSRGGGNAWPGSWARKSNSNSNSNSNNNNNNNGNGKGNGNGAEGIGGGDPRALLRGVGSEVKGIPSHALYAKEALRRIQHHHQIVNDHQHDPDRQQYTRRAEIKQQQQQGSGEEKDKNKQGKQQQRQQQQPSSVPQLHVRQRPMYMLLAAQHVHDPYGDGTETTLAQRRTKYVGR